MTWKIDPKVNTTNGVYQQVMRQRRNWRARNARPAADAARVVEEAHDYYLKRKGGDQSEDQARVKETIQEKGGSTWRD